MAQTDAKNRNASGGLADQLKADASLIGIAGARRQYDRIGTQLQRLRCRNLVIAGHGDCLAQLPQEMEEVVSKAVIVIDQQNHPISPDSGPQLPRLVVLFKQTVAEFAL